ncbi:MAG TPA: HEPN domain-containing protein [Bryobacteraceae bacterium]|nr:HEPN domain-containing protein [Bryobacteraceae bacterium]
MKQREQAELLLRKASQDEALLDEVIGSERVSDEVIGFHCQQAAEKLLKALLSDLGVAFRKTHELGALLELLVRSGVEVPNEFADLDALTPYGALYRYDDFDARESLDRQGSRSLLRSLRGWVESRLGDRSGPRE